MKPMLITGGCGFVGRHVTKYALKNHLTDSIWLVDDLFTGRDPASWLPRCFTPARVSPTCTAFEHGGIVVYFVKDDVRAFFAEYLASPFARDLPRFGDVIHLASIVGGRALIDGDPLLVATDLAIDAEMFHWARLVKPDRILYPSSSAAYPIDLQGTDGSVPLKESYIQFDNHVGLPDMTYGWSKLTGEYLSRIAARSYGLHVACIRPFSGYGEDQEPVYPVPAIAERAARKEDPLIVWGTGRQARDFVHIDDCVDFLFSALETIGDGSGVNIGSGVLTSFLDVAQTFADIAGYSPVIQPLVDKPVGVQNRYADTTVLTTKFRWAPSTSLKDGFSRVYLAACQRISGDENWCRINSQS
jgi:UDP-glucose 4-epimerase